MELQELFYKADHSSDKWEPYFEVYQRHLTRYKDKPITLVEVGVQRGGSLDMWAQFLHPDSKIIGIDVDPECANLEYKYPNVKVLIGDQVDPAFWDEFLKDNSVDVFIDDGGHTMVQQITTFEKVFPKLNMGGTFICEDTHTSYWPHCGGKLFSKDSFIEYSKRYVDILHFDWKQETVADLEIKNKIASNGLSGLFFYDSMVVFEKFGKRNMYRVFAK